MVKIEWNGQIHETGPLDGRPSSISGELLGVRAARLYVTVESRNAWHSTTSRKYSGNWALYPFLSLAKQHAEERRKPGSQFIIRESPGLVFYSSKAAVFMTDFHPEVPFGKWDASRASEVFRIGTHMLHVIRAFATYGFWTTKSNTRKDSLVNTTIRLDQWLDPALWSQFDFVEPDSKFANLTSKAVGSGYKLAWTKSDAKCSARGALAIENAFVAVNGHEAVEAAYDMHIGSIVRNHQAKKG